MDSERIKMSDLDKRKAERKFKENPSSEAAGKLLQQKARSGEASPTVYCVVAVDYEYNDEYYYTTEGCGYTIRKLFSHRGNAEKVCADLNRERFLGLAGPYGEIGSWLGEDNSFFASDEIDGQPIDVFLDQFGLTFGSHVDDNDNANAFVQSLVNAHKAKKISSDAIDKIIAASSLSFFKVETFDLSDGVCGQVG